MFFGEQNQIFILYTRWPSEATGIKQSYHFCYSTYYLRLRSPIDMDYHLMSNSIYLPVCQSNLASTILASLLTAESNGFS